MYVAFSRTGDQGGGGDVSSNTASSVDSEIALFSGTAGKTIKRASTTGILKATGGVLSAATAGTDYAAAGAITGSGLTQATARLLGRTTASTGAIEEISVSGATLSGGTLTISAPTAATGASMALLSTVTASSSATVDIETTFDGTYDAYVLTGSKIDTATNATTLLCQLKIGGSYLNSAYQWHNMKSTSGAATYSGANSTNSTSIQLNSSTDTLMDFTMWIFHPSDTTAGKAIRWDGVCYDGTCSFQSGVGQHANTAALTGVRIFAGTGNVASGTFRLYGLKNS